MYEATSIEADIIQVMMLMEQSDLDVLQAALAQRQPPVQPQSPKLRRFFGRKVAAHEMVRLVAPIGSSNDRLWSMLEEAGWMLSADGSFPVPANSYTIREQGWEPLSALMDWLAYVRRNRSKAITDIHYTLAVPFVTDLVSNVKTAGGDGKDIGTIAAFVLARCVRACVQPHAYDAILDRITAKARAVLHDEIPEQP